MLTGNPTRREFSRLTAAGGTPGRFRLLVLGGSQGARIFSDVVPAALRLLPSGAARAAGRGPAMPARGSGSRCAPATPRAGSQPELASFFTDVPDRMARADLVITRSGASTVAELLALGRPSLLVPYHAAADDHQTANARALADAGAAVLVPAARIHG